MNDASEASGWDAHRRNANRTSRVRRAGGHPAISIAYESGRQQRVMFAFSDAPPRRDPHWPAQQRALRLLLLGQSHG